MWAFWLQILPYYFILVGGLKACRVITHLNSSSNDLLTFHPKKKCCIVKHISLQDSRFLSWTGWDNQCQRWSALCSAFRSFTFSASWKHHVQDNVSNCQVEINTTRKQLSELAGWTFQGLYMNSLLCILFQPLFKDCREKLHKNMQGEWKNVITALCKSCTNTISTIAVITSGTSLSKYQTITFTRKGSD